MVPEQRCPIWSIHSTRFRQLYDITRIPHDITPSQGSPQRKSPVNAMGMPFTPKVLKKIQQIKKTFDGVGMEAVCENLKGFGIDPAPNADLDENKWMLAQAIMLFTKEVD